MFLKSTKNILKKTLNSVKSLFSCGDHYHKLSKSPTSFDGLDISYIELEKFYSDKQKLSSTENVIGNGVTDYSSPKHENVVPNPKTTRESVVLEDKKRSGLEEREARIMVVAEKLKEVAIMMEADCDGVAIEEVIYYYSCLTCPAYLDIVDKFFTDVCSEFFRPPQAPVGATPPPPPSTDYRRKKLRHSLCRS